MVTVYSPGCALLLYKPHLADKILVALRQIYPDIRMHRTCCHHNPSLPERSLIVNTCPGCNRRFNKLYEGISTVSLWEVLDRQSKFPFPDHSGLTVTLLDACPVRKAGHVHQAVRSVLSRMNIRINEEKHSRQSSKCCGDSFYGHIPKEQVMEKMKERAGEMPEQQVAVYCVSCVKSMSIGGKTPRYLPDLLYSEETSPGECDPNIWHDEVDRFISTH